MALFQPSPSSPTSSTQRTSHHTRARPSISTASTSSGFRTRPSSSSYFHLALPEESPDASPPPPPPSTTHYWTSDSTRRIEYAAIDAANHGFRAWLRRYLVPECLVPRHVSFDDDYSGSVRRYRLDLDDDDDEDVDEKAQSTSLRRRRRRWFSSSPRGGNV